MFIFTNYSSLLGFVSFPTVTLISVSMNISIILRTELSFQKFIKSTKVMNYIIIRFTHQYMTLQSQNKMKVKYIF